MNYAWYCLVAFILVVSGCAQKKMIFIPKEYSYPEDSLVNGKTFVYQKAGTTEQSLTKLGIRREGSLTYLVNRHYTADNKVFDSTVTLGDKLIAFYSFNNEKGIPLKGGIIQDTVIANGTKYGVRSRRMVFKTGDYASDNTSDQEYLKDTALEWKGKKIDCIVMKATSTTQLYLNSDNAAQQLVSYHMVYLAKGIGLVRYTTQFKNEYYVFDLVEIR